MAAVSVWPIVHGRSQREGQWHWHEWALLPQACNSSMEVCADFCACLVRMEHLMLHAGRARPVGIDGATP